MNRRNHFSFPACCLAPVILLQTFQLATAAPEVTQIEADFDSKTISISGSNLGQGPNILIYDTFDSPLSVSGEPLPLRASVLGQWTEFHQYNTPVFSGIGRSGSYSFRGFDGETQKTNLIQLSFEGTQEVFISYWIFLEGPKYFPGGLVSGPRTFSEDSSFKLTWLLDTDVKGNSSDVVLPTHVGGGIFYLAGNDTNLVTSIGNEWWSWDNWMRLSFWLKADPGNPTGSGTIHFDTLSKDKGYKERIYNTAIFDEDGPEIKQYQQLNFPGWVRSIQSSSTNIVYDDIYISTGSNAAARVELGDAALLKDVTKLELLKIDTWSDTNIRATAPTVNEEELGKLFLYITNSNGVTNEQGIPLSNAPAQIKIFEVN